jgi:hypothetical protein
MNWVPARVTRGRVSSGRLSRALCAAAGVFGGVCLAGGVATPAMAQVLVNQPASRVCVSRTFKVGVWYQDFTGGSRAYRLDVYGPGGSRILHKHGDASATAWKFWHVRATRTGKYRTVYFTRSKGAWHPYRAATKAHRC